MTFRDSDVVILPILSLSISIAYDNAKAMAIARKKKNNINC